MARKKIEKKDQKAPSPKGPFRLNLGCGEKKIDGFINIDNSDNLEGVLKFDLENCEEKRLPYPDGSVEIINASHVLEHITNLIRLMNECWRVMKTGGVFTIQVPIYPSAEAFQDPTHVRYFTQNTFRYFLEGDQLYEYNGKMYGIKPWRLAVPQRVVNGWEMGVTLKK